MSNEMPEQNPEVVELKRKVGDMLKKVIDHLKYVNTLDLASKKRELDSLGNQAPQHMVDTYNNIEAGRRTLEGMIEDLESCEIALEAGRLNTTPVDKISDVLAKQEEIWNREFVPSQK